MLLRTVKTRYICCFALLFGLGILFLAPYLHHRSHAVSAPQKVKEKYVLAWTKFFGQHDFIPSPNQVGCGDLPCIITTNRAMFNQADAVVLHLRDLDSNDLPVNHSLSSQVWVLLNHEAPPHTPRIPDQLKSSINWTITYRQDSEVILTPSVIKEDTMIKPQNWWLHKTRKVVWFVSNCHTSSNREGFVKELSKYISVDIVGSCGTQKCLPKMSKDCYQKASKQYFFYLAFENSLCKDYVTEKLYSALDWGMVPVVLGGVDYERVTPPNSFINALSFASPKHLAEHLKNVAKDPLLYNSYHAWRQRYRIVGKHYICNLCRKLHETTTTHVYNDINDWWFGPASCRRWESKERRSSRVSSH